MTASAGAAGARSQDHTERPRLGFACLWGTEPERTWSGTPWALRAALTAELPVVDVGPAPSLALRAALKALALRREGGRWVSPWRWSPAWERAAHDMVRRGARRHRPDALLQIGDFGVFDLPYFLYQDLSYDVLTAHLAPNGGSVPGFEGLRGAALERRRRRQQDVYARARGVFAMSQWFAEALVRESGVPRERVHVAGAGIHVRPPASLGPIRSTRDRTRLLFVGRDFERKGGPLVVAAAGRLREQGSEVTLTIAGPASWPLPGDPPPWVDFRGGVSTSEVSRLLVASDLFVMPSRFEAFGIAFAEALAHGVPCVARRAFAMPELVADGLNGALVDSDDVDALAETIERVRRDDAIHEQCARMAPAVADRCSWERVAHHMADVITAELS